ncbi:FlgO family outer membrane protein [Motiliproteus sp. SC1-56]|uniref:FlgO family outer membrane protein n=1 Tax=Motiliproteus sp. SC1-56 TaxID=2799565 RepID=UPI001A8F3B92|nr:FlgO family outer membrane protein [Motiliproteus sp. SC1-56]
MGKALGVAVLLITVAGCVQQPVPVVVTGPVQTHVLSVPEPHSALSPEPASGRAALKAPVAPLGEAVRRMAEQLEAGLREKGIRTLPIAITPFVALEAAPSPGVLGNEIAEGFFHELQARGFNLIDHTAIAFQTGHAPKHPQALSDFYREHRISYVLSGTYSTHSDGVVIQARLLDSVSRQVAATGQARVPSAALEGGLPGYNPLSSQQGMIIENGGVPAQ